MTLLLGYNLKIAISVWGREGRIDFWWNGESAVKNLSSWRGEMSKLLDGGGTPSIPQYGKTCLPHWVDFPLTLNAIRLRIRLD